MDVMRLRIVKFTEENLRKYIVEISVGNDKALEEFYDEYGRLLLALIFSIVKNRESAEEVLQDVLLAIVNHQSNIPIINAKSWLFKVVENLSKKKFAEDRAMQTEMLSEDEGVSFENDVSEKIENAVDQIESIGILNELEQQIVIMRVFGGMKLPQVAEYLNMPYKVVRNKYNYAVTKLKNTM